MNKILLLTLLLFITPFVIVQAHPGRTDSTGNHTCRTNCTRWGLSYGEYHNHNSGWIIPPVTYEFYPPTPRFPDIQAKWNWLPENNGTFHLGIELLDPNPSKYSVVLSKCSGCDPGPLVDFTTSSFLYKEVSPGRWYLNVKKQINGVWSTVAYWTIDVPKWYPPPTPTPFPSPTSTTSQSFNQSDISYISLIFFGIAGYLLFQLIKRLRKP